ncbi:hypothetical protein HK099_005748 [Clydaea vesicula]|uniref:Uncharacterized protein n=1 Tax=Clydaea vesicula TaxID=447962 RepID=A0AAD5TZ27_9FUNG|nr:hypothetical protein HK099_005748 [Clydaea vesicula]
MSVVKKSLLAILAANLISSQLNCGINNAGAVCGTTSPCCSEYGVCGTTSLHCGGGCQSKYSSPAGLNSENAACFQDRPSVKSQKCKSGVYDFGPSTWIVNTEAWNGDVNQADFTIDNYQNQTENIEIVQGATKMWLRPTSQTTVPGMGVRVSSTSYLNYGFFSVKLRGGSPPGMVTSFISMSDVKDEIDWEFTGGDRLNGQTNIFYKISEGGAIDYTNGARFPVPDWSTTTSEYGVDWSESKIDFLINGQVVRTVLASAGNFPNTPSRIQLAVWDGADGQPEGTRNWAMGGPGFIDWTAGGSQGYYATIEQITIKCAGDTTPTGAPERPAGYTAPTLNNKAMKIAVNGLAGSDYFKIGSALNAAGNSSSSSTTTDSTDSTNTSTGSKATNSTSKNGNSKSEGFKIGTLSNFALFFGATFFYCSIF